MTPVGTDKTSLVPVNRMEMYCVYTDANASIDTIIIAHRAIVIYDVAIVSAPALPPGKGLL
jgi:hypothetical protein